LKRAGEPTEIEDSDYGLRDFLIETPDGHRLLFGTDLA
jgi:hypothetical protein